MAGELGDAQVGFAALCDARRLDEQLVVAVLTFGEGWHNNHHAYPTSARHGLAWFEVDLNWMGIRTLEAFGLAWDIKTARIKHGASNDPGDLPPPSSSPASPALPSSETYVPASTSHVS